MCPLNAALSGQRKKTDKYKSFSPLEHFEGKHFHRTHERKEIHHILGKRAQFAV